jgi:PAS domain S-box-containing protein
MTAVNETIPIQPLRALLSSGDSNEVLVKQITDLFPALIYVYDMEKSRIRYVNRRISDMLGYSWEEVGTWKEDLSKMVYEADISAVLSKFEQISTGEDECVFECRLNHKDQGYRIFKTVGTTLGCSGDGKPPSLLLMAQDITEQVRAVQDRERTRRLMDDTEQMLGMGMWTYDRTTGKTEWTDGMYQLLGYTREEMPEIEDGFFYKHVTLDDLAQLRKNVREAIRTGKECRTDFSVDRRDGKRLYIMATTKPVLDEAGNVIRLNGINRDISDQYQQLVEYRANKEFQKETERMLNYGMFIWNADSQMLSWSDGLFELFEYDKSDLELPITLRWFLNHVVDDDRERVQHILEEAITHRNEFEMEYSILTGKGKLKIVNTKGSVVVDYRNIPSRIIGNTRDITHLKKVEVELQRNIRELNRSNKELEEFAYAASHDLQEPLRKITTFGSRLSNKFADLLDDEGKMYLNRMQAATEHMRNLIENLLELSRVSRNKQPFEPVDMNQLIPEVLNDLELSIEEQQARIKVGPLPVVEGIPSLLRQLLINILSNSIKFHKPDESPRIEISARRLTRKEKEEHYLPPSTAYIQIDVQDHGIGFDQEYEQRIFQVFQRLHGKSAYPGSGLGLAICKRIAERHNGFISAVGKEGEGALFSIILPEKH